MTMVGSVKWRLEGRLFYILALEHCSVHCVVGDIFEWEPEDRFSSEVKRGGGQFYVPALHC